MCRREDSLLQTLLEVWGGTWFLLNKIGFSRAERAITEKVRAKRKVRAWICYLIGLPAWLIIFIIKKDWMVLTIETVGIIPIIFNIVATLRKEKTPRWLDTLSLASAVIGIAISFAHFGVLQSIDQGLEFGSVVGFLVGAYLLGKGRASGYLWFLLMNGSMGLLMFQQEHPWLAIQQLASLGFVVDAYLIKKRLA